MLMSYSKVKGGDIDLLLAPPQSVKPQNTEQNKTSVLHKDSQMWSQGLAKAGGATATPPLTFLCSRWDTILTRWWEAATLLKHHLRDFCQVFQSLLFFSSLLLTPTRLLLLYYYWFSAFYSVNPYFCNPYYYPWQGEGQIRFWLLPKINKQTKQKLFIRSLKSHEL